MVSNTTQIGWKQLGDFITGDDSNDNMGWSVAMSADGYTIAVGAKTVIFNSSVDYGYVRVFSYNGVSQQWEQRGTDIFDTNIPDIGYSLSISHNGNVLAIGANLADTVNGVDSGMVRVYAWNGVDNYVQLGGDLPGEDVDDKSGWSVALSANGHVVAMGSRHGNNGLTGLPTGNVRLFSYNSGTGVWDKLGQDLDGDAHSDHFGWSVSLSDDGYTLAVGANYSSLGGDSRAGLARVFTYNTLNDEWEQFGNDLLGEDANDNFGVSVSLSANGLILAVGASWDDINGERSGSVRVFGYNAGFQQWQPIGQTIKGVSPSDEIGSWVALNAIGNTIAIGAREATINGNFATGFVLVYTYDSDNSNWTQVGQQVNGSGSKRLGRSVDISSDGSIFIAGEPQSFGRAHVYQQAQVSYLFSRDVNWYENNLPVTKIRHGAYTTFTDIQNELTLNALRTRSVTLSNPDVDVYALSSNTTTNVVFRVDNDEFYEQFRIQPTVYDDIYRILFQGTNTTIDSNSTQPQFPATTSISKNFTLIGIPKIVIPTDITFYINGQLLMNPDTPTEPVTLPQGSYTIDELLNAFGVKGTIQLAYNDLSNASSRHKFKLINTSSTPTTFGVNNSAFLDRLGFTVYSATSRNTSGGDIAMEGGGEVVAQEEPTTTGSEGTNGSTYASVIYHQMEIVKSMEEFVDTDAITKEYVDFKLEELIGGAPELLDTLSEIAAAMGDDNDFANTVRDLQNNVSDNVSTEIYRATTIEDSLDKAISSEESRAESAELSLYTMFSSDNVRAVSTEASLASVIYEEFTRASTEEYILEKSISSEEFRAESAELSLYQMVSEETVRSVSTESSLATVIVQEFTRASGEEYILEKSISSEEFRAESAELSLFQSISSETSRAVSTEASLATVIREEYTRASTEEYILEKSISGEEFRAVSAELSLYTMISTEVFRADSVEDRLSESISTELGRATAAEAILSSDISESGYLYDVSITELVSTDTSVEVHLSKEIYKEFSDLQSSDVYLQGRIDTKAAATDTEFQTLYNGAVVRNLDNTLTGDLRMGYAYVYISDYWRIRASNDGSRFLFEHNREPNGDGLWEIAMPFEQLQG